MHSNSTGEASYKEGVEARVYSVIHPDGTALGQGSGREANVREANVRETNRLCLYWSMCSAGMRNLAGCITGHPVVQLDVPMCYLNL